MNDLISRQAVLDRTVNRNSIWNKITDSEGNNLEDILNSISYTESKREWIPVSKRLPEKSGEYWCTFGGTYLTGSDYYTTESDAKEIFDDNWEEYIGWRSQNVIAWMSKPEPYKKGK